MKAFVETGFQNNNIVSEHLQSPEWEWDHQRNRNPNIPKHLSLKQTVLRLLSKNYYPSFAEFVTTTFADDNDAKLFLSLEAIHK
jgi:tyrosinase